MINRNPVARTLDTPVVNRFVSIIGRLAICYLFCTAALFHLTFGHALTLAEMHERGLPFAALLNVAATAIFGALLAWSCTLSNQSRPAAMPATQSQDGVRL